MMVAQASMEAAQDLMASAVALVEAAGVPYETDVPWATAWRPPWRTWPSAAAAMP